MIYWTTITQHGIKTMNIFTHLKYVSQTLEYDYDKGIIVKRVKLIENM